MVHLDSAANRPSILLYEADRAAILLLILKYYADSAAIDRLMFENACSIACRYMLVGFKTMVYPHSYTRGKENPDSNFGGPYLWMLDGCPSDILWMLLMFVGFQVIEFLWG